MKYLIATAVLGVFADYQIPRKPAPVTTYTYEVQYTRNDSVLLTDKCLLYETGGKSFFYSLNKLAYKKAMTEKLELAMRNGGQIHLSQSDGQMLTNFIPFSIIKEREKDRAVVVEEVDGQSLAYIKDSSLKRSWKLHTDTSTISGLRCRKATFQDKGLQVTAWYSRDIPVAEGPLNYSGLPGLIVQVENNKGWSARLLEVKYKQRSEDLSSIPVYSLTTEQRLAQIKKEHRQRLLNPDKSGEKVTLSKKD